MSESFTSSWTRRPGRAKSSRSRQSRARSTRATRDSRAASTRDAFAPRTSQANT